MGEMVEFASNGSTARGYLGVPPSGSGPGVILIQEWWGLVPHIKELVDRFAADGFVTLAPDLYEGTTTIEPDEAGKLMMALKIDQAAKMMSGAVDFLLAHESVGGDGVGVIGFCMGGGLALVLAAHRPDAVKAVVPFYGLIPWPDAQPDWSQIQARVEGHFAAEDGFFSAEMARDLEQTLRNAGVDAEIVIHPGVDHAFANDHRPEVYDRDQAEAALASSRQFLAQALA
jgi:carboxymethylenebutenolidase